MCVCVCARVFVCSHSFFIKTEFCGFQLILIHRIKLAVLDCKLISVF